MRDEPPSSLMKRLERLDGTERLVGGDQVVRDQGNVPLRHGQARVAEDALEGQDVAARAEVGDRERMAQAVRMNALDLRSLAQALERRRQPWWPQRLALFRLKERIVGVF